MLCSVACQRFFFLRWAMHFFLLLCTAHPTKNVQHILGSPALPATEVILAQTPPTGATPPAHVGARTPAATHKHTRSPPRTKHLRRSRQRRRRATHLSSPPSPARPPNTLSRPRPYPRRRQPALTDAGIEYASPVLPIPEEEQKQVNASNTRRRPKHAQAPPATQMLAATRPEQCPPRARAAGLADAGCGTGTGTRSP